jgi:hypothetical protein
MYIRPAGIVLKKDTEKVANKYSSYSYVFNGWAVMRLYAFFSGIVQA